MSGITPRLAARHAARPRAAAPPDPSPGGEPRPRPFHRSFRRRAMSLIARLRRDSRREITQRISALILGMITIAAISSWHGSGGIAAAAATPGDDGTIEPMPFEQPGASFPGSAYYYLAPDQPAAAGSAQPLAPEAHWDGDAAAANSALPGPGPSARALAQAGSAIDRSRALSCLTAAIYYEAASEPDGGQRAVAQVILNRMAHPSFPKTVCGVVYQGSERSTGCQFTFTCDGALARTPARFFWLRAEAVARDALAGYVYTPVGLATHYHTFAIHPYWADSLNFIGQIGAHRFYRFKGPAGTPGAFRFAYAGGEPLSAPHAHSAVVRADSAPDPLVIQKAYEQGRQGAQAGLTGAGSGGSHFASYAAPAYTGEALQRGGDSAFRGAKLPGANGAVAEHQASGAWIAQPE